LELWARGEGGIGFPRDFLLPIGFPEFLLVVAGLAASRVRAFFEIREGTGVCDTRIDTHVTFPSDDPRKLGNSTFNLVV
jgi:hypothetical protein